MFIPIVIKPLVLTKQLFFILFFTFFARHTYAYSVLSHEALIDASWEHSLVPLLKNRFPTSTEEDIKNAKAYAYGGAVAPDMGYYPFGNALYTNLVHYVRSGDLVVSLLNKANTLNQYAFAIGFLCHYNADQYGHPIGVNRSVPLVYPKLGQKFGPVVTYAEDKVSHLKMEFSFDVLQTARGNYASQAYHDYIGFKVDTTVLSEAFQDTYGLNLQDLFGGRLSLAIGTFRFAVKNLIPFVTKAAWSSKKGEIRKTNPTSTGRSFTYRMHRKQYEQEFGNNYQKPGFFARVFAFLIPILPKIGPLKVFKFKPPTLQAENNFIKSFDTVLTHYTASVNKLNHQQIALADIDFDTGKPTKPGEYSLADQTYKDLLLKLDKDNFANTTKELRHTLTQFFSRATTLNVSTKDSTDINKALADLQKLSSGGKTN
jgi:hypothetical protein